MSNKITANIGEWSELYALLFLLKNGGLYSADSDQTIKKELFFKVLKIIFEQDGILSKKISYHLDDNSINVFWDNNCVATLDNYQLISLTEKLLIALQQNNQGRAFSLEIGDEVLTILKKESIKTSNQNKKDLDLIILNPYTQTEHPQIGFSVKSQLGSPSTLVNASRATHFIYEVFDSDGILAKNLSAINSKKVKEKIVFLKNLGCQFQFVKTESSIFEKNLSLLDSQMAQYLAKIVLLYYQKQATNLEDLVLNAFHDLPNNNLEQASFKIKEFLSVMALGMMPNKSWDGILTSLGGMILVKKDGLVLCYYLYNMLDFQNFLLKNTKLDTASTSRHDFGYLYFEDGHYYIKLNLQVRFLK